MTKMSPVSGVELDVGGAREVTLNREDCLCPVCLEIFIEPVTLPCTHTFCKSCFLESVDKSTLCCPLCRKRISTWARLNSKRNTLVDQQLWTRIQTAFPQQCQRRLSGQDTEDEYHPVSGGPRVSRPGELRQEYEDQVTKLMEERRALDEEEKRASEELIQRLLTEEEELLQEERRRKDEDEQLARQLSNQLNSQEVLRVSIVTPAKKKEVVVGHMDRFLCPRAPQPLSTSSFVFNKENILFLEAEFQVDRPRPQTDKSQLIRSSSVKRKSSELDCSEEKDSTIKRAMMSSSSFSLEAGLGTEWEAGLQVDRPCPQTDESQLIRSSTVKRKSSELDYGEEQDSTTKEELMSSSSFPLEAGLGAEWEAELQKRQRQEEEDRRLALLLQKQLDQEERQRATDRRKGSSDAYLLRRQKGGKEGAGLSNTPGRGSSKSARTATSSSSPHSSSSLRALPSSSSLSRRSIKQTTLTDIFSPPRSSSSSSSSSAAQTNSQE